MYRQFRGEIKLVSAHGKHLIIVYKTHGVCGVTLLELSTLTCISSVESCGATSLFEHSHCVEGSVFDIQETKATLHVKFAEPFLSVRIVFNLRPSDVSPLRWVNRDHEILYPTRVFIAGNAVYNVPIHLSDFLTIPNTRFRHNFGWCAVALQHCGILPELIRMMLTIIATIHMNTEYREYCRPSQHC